MPTLKQLSCSIELGGTNTKLKEYGTEYGDGNVTSYVAVPTEEVHFSVHLTSKGYIAPGLAMFVYMDGQYQCNRNRRGLVVPGSHTPSEQYQVDLRVRQKESKQPDGTFLGRDWTFHGLNLVSADKVEKTSDGFLENMGTIEVIVLRCKEAPKPPVTTSSRTVSSWSSSTTLVPSTPPKKSASRQDKASNETSSKAKPAEKAPSKAKSEKKESEVGGLFGIFDGSADEPPGFQAKSYWASWNKRPVSSSKTVNRAPLYIAPEEPLPQVPAAAAKKQNVEHQVKTGKGAQYMHLCARPEYLDEMKRPYAVFTFKYRSRKTIEKMFNIRIKEEGQSLKAKLADMTRDELAEELFRLKMANSGKGTSTTAGSQKAPSVAQASPETQKSKKDEPANQDWPEPTQNTQADSSWDKIEAKDDWGTPAQDNTQEDNNWGTSAPDNTETNNVDQTQNTNDDQAESGSNHSKQSDSKKSASKASMPGSWPGANDPAADASKQASGGASDHSKSQANASAQDPKGEEKKEEETPAGGWADTANTGDNQWDTTATTGADNNAWGGGNAGDQKDDVAWRTILVTIGIVTGIVILVAVYYWIWSYVLCAIAGFHWLKGCLLDTFASVRGYMLWIAAGYRWLVKCILWTFAWIKFFYAKMPGGNLDMNLSSRLPQLNISASDVLMPDFTTPDLPQLNMSMPDFAAWRLKMPGFPRTDFFRVRMPWSSSDIAPAILQVFQDGVEDVVEDCGTELASSFP